MKKKFTFLIAAFVLLLNLFVPVGMWGQTRTTVTYKLTIGANDFNTTSYAANNNEKTSNAVCTTDNTKTYEVKWTSNQVMKNSSNMQWQKNNGYIYNSTDLGTITNVTITSSAGSFTTYYGTSAQPSSGSSGEGKGYFKTSVGNATGTTSKMEVTFQIEEGGSTTTTTTTIDDSGITNTNVYTGTAAGTLSASVTYDNSGTPTAVPEASVTWSGDDDDVATIDEDTGEVTLVGAGTVTFTATYAGNDDYSTSSDTYEMTVINEDPSLVTIWSEDFSSYSADDVPAGGKYSYACTNGGGTTKIYENANTGGVSPELLVGKSNGTFTAIIPLLNSTYGYDGDLTLQYKTNAKSLNVKTTTSDITIEGESSSGAGITYNTYGEHTITFKGVTISTENITIVFTTMSGENVRLDDILLKGKQAALTKVATPTISPASGAVVSGTEVTMTCGTADATIYYTTDGATPSSNSTAYNPASKPTITSACTIKAIGIKAGLTDSEVTSASYTIAEPCATPTFSVPAGEVEKGTTVTISTETDGATIYYTTNGSDPTTSSSTYSSAITINSAMTIKAIAAKEGNANSAVASASYTVKDYATLPFSWAGGTSSGLTAITGVTASGLGSDYAEGNAPYRVKFDGTGDYIQIKTDSQPGIVTIGVKMVGGGNTSYITVKGSADGTTFDEGEQLTISGKQNDILTLKSTRSFASNVRHVRLYFQKGDNVGVGPIEIAKQISGEVSYASLTISANDTYIVSNGGVLTVTSSIINNGTAANLIIEEGGQIILPEDASVSATIKRSVKGNAKAAEWEAFASTINNPAIGSTNLITGTYDLYMYDEAATGAEWRNYKANTGAFANLANSRGYLYRNAATMDITITGSLNTSDISTYTLSRNSGDANIIGFNFVGNPYQMEIYKGVAISNEYLETGYYVLENGGWAVKDDNVAIAPGAGILVQAKDGGHNQALDITYTGASAKANHDNIMFTVKNSEYSDVSYAMFDKGHGLNKIEHRNANIPMLYIPQNGERFAIAMMDDNTQMFDLSFKAMTTGKYTISINAKGNFSYIHLIDRLTGDDTNLLIEDYSFVGSPKDNAERFIVKLSYDNDSSTGSETFAYQSGNEIIVNGEGALEVYDVTGRKVMTTTINGVETINGLNSGVYIFRVFGETQRTQKIVVR